MMRRIVTSSLVVVALLVGTPAAFASPIAISTFTGLGQSGALATGLNEPWLINCASTGPNGTPCPTGDFGWGSPGVAETITPYVGTTPADDFEITFPDFVIDGNQVTVGDGDNCAGREGGGTTFCSLDPSQVATFWTPVFNEDDPHSIAFFAPPGTELDNTDTYFVNIFLTNPASDNGALPASISFSGAWTSEAPEPVTLLLFGTGLVGVAAVRRRQRGRRG